MTDLADLLDALSEALQARARVFPARGAEYDRLMELVKEVHARLVAAAIAEPPDAAWKAPAFRTSLHLCGAMKAGTTLLAQLFDGHPQLFVMPGDSYPLLRRTPGNEEETRAITFHWLQRLINPTGREPFWFLPRQWDALVAFIGVLRREMLSGPVFWAAASSALGSRIQGGVETDTARILVEKTPENELHVAELLRCDPSARFLQIVRHPLANLAALTKISEVRGWNCGPLGHARRLGVLHKQALANQAELGAERCMTIRYEDLTANPEKIMRRAAEWAGIEWTESLLVPTIGGRDAVSNSAYRKDIVVGRVLDKSDPAEAARQFDTLRRTLIGLAGGTSHRKFGYRLHPRKGFWMDEAAP